MKNLKTMTKRIFSNPEKTKEKMSLARKEKTWEEIFGIAHAKRMKKEMSLLVKTEVGAKNRNWKDDISYGALHQWIRRHLPKTLKCEKCNKIVKSSKYIHWVNKSGKYLRNLKDWIRLSVSCHKVFDDNFMVAIRKRL